MMIRIKARDTADPAKMVRSRPKLFFFCFGDSVVFAKYDPDSKVVVPDL